MKAPAKNKQHFLRALLIASLIVSSGFRIDPGVTPAPNAGANESGPAFELLKNENNIRIFSRWLPVTDTRKARQLKAEMTCQGPLGEVVSLICDDGSVTKWLGGARTCSRLKTIDAHHWYTYVRFSVIWPLKDQDCVLAVELTESPDGKSCIIRETSLNNYLRVIDGVTRIPHLECEWTLRTEGDNSVKVEYTLFSKQVSKFPRWITDPIIQNNLLKSMDVFRSLVKTLPS
jgi:hypothetical protein